MISTTTKINTTRTGENQRRSDAINNILGTHNIFACVAFATGSAYKWMLASVAARVYMDFRSQRNASKSEPVFQALVIILLHSRDKTSALLFLNIQKKAWLLELEASTAIGSCKLSNDWLAMSGCVHYCLSRRTY